MTDIKDTTGTTLFSTMYSAHITQNREDTAINNEFNSSEYIRHIILSEIFADVKASAEIFIICAGGPMQSACDLNIIREKRVDQSRTTKNRPTLGKI